MILSKLDLFALRGNFCQCGCGQWAHDAHHWAIHNIKKKGKAVYKELQDERNLVLVNHHEHVDLRLFDTPEWRKKFWKLQCLRYGEPAMMEWVNSLPDKIRGRIDFIK